MMFRSLVQCFHYFIFIADFEWNSSLSRSSLQFDTLLSDRWYGFIKCDFMVIKTLTLIKAAMIGCLVTVQAQAQAHSLIYFFFIGNWCVFFLLFTLLLRRFSSIHSMCFSSICIWHADQIDSINNFIFSTEKNVRSHRILFVKWCEYQSTMEISTKKFYSLISRSLHITVFAVCICIYACNDNRKI